ncbi:Conserved_hypothetical protein [Hexamita inflata]|uniref:Uncharacterized protein n=1 Tax=Hexamita inflata TaxID=28002 RepID=A0AA86V146_9EUKA|nr:Conserved hypothetical protein [Hexamita inflata]
MDPVNLQQQKIIADNIMASNFMIVYKSLANLNINQKIKNRARQMRTEALAWFFPLRNDSFPSSAECEPYKLVSLLSDEVRKQNGQKIYIAIQGNIYQNILKFIAPCCKRLIPQRETS